MILTVTVLLALIVSNEASSRYFVYTFTNPDGIVNMAYPLDICINYEVDSNWLHATATYKYAMFECNINNDEITMITYDTDPQCSPSKGSVHSKYSKDSYSKTGDLHSFNCIGEDNFAEIMVYKDDDTCCGSYTVSNTATDICYYNGTHNTYLMTICDENGVTSTYQYSSSQCNDNDINKIRIRSSDDNKCTFYKTISYHDIYVRMNRCIDNGTIIDESKYCITTTSLPTAPTNIPSPSPTLPSMDPTAIPTISPTSRMDAKLFGNISNMNAIIGGCIFMILIIMGIAIYCYMKKKQRIPYNKKNVLINEEEEIEQHERIAMDPVINNNNNNNNMNNNNIENQEIIGTAEEINVASIDSLR